jgi:3-deoxy-D-manno-octulosonate 8-phosphate phosphatase (KDO 8-P phosphatase)
MKEQPLIHDDFTRRARAVRCILFDVDGVLTDGRITLDNAGVESKSFHVRDGHGIKLAQRKGLQVGLLTGRSSRVVDYRAAELGVTLVHQGSKRKEETLARIVEETGLPLEAFAFMGDDVVDIPVLSRVGLPCAVADAVAEVRRECLFVSSRPGGGGAARELIEHILAAQGLWEEIIGEYEQR